MADEGRHFANPFRFDQSCQHPKRSKGKGEDPLQVAVETVLSDFITQWTSITQMIESMRDRLLSVVTAELPTVDREYISNRRDQSVYTGVAGVTMLWVNNEAANLKLLLFLLLLLHQVQLSFTSILPQQCTMVTERGARQSW